MEVNPGIKRTAAMVVLRHQQAFLLLKRKNMPYQGHYLPVGGKVSPYERPIDAALRETLEETGIRIDKQQLSFGGVLVESSPTDYNWQSFIYLADIGFVPPPPCPEGTLEWIAFKDIPSVPTPPTDWQIYQYLMQQRPFTLDALYNEKLELLEMREEISGQVVWVRG